MIKCEQDKQIQANIAIVLDRLDSGIKIEDNEIVLEEQPMKKSHVSTDWDILQEYKESISGNGCIAWAEVDKALKHFCLKPEFLSEIYKHILNIDYK